MKLRDFLAFMEDVAPLCLAEEWDNVGLLVGTTHTEIERVLLALDATPEAVAEAARVDAQLLLTHHPLMIHGTKRLMPGEPAYELIRRNIGHYCAHTNLDSAVGGVNDVLAELFGLTDTRPLQPSAHDLRAGLGRVGDIAPQPLEALARAVAHALKTPVRVCGDGARMVSRAAICGGGGSSLIDAARSSGAQVYISGDLKHHEALGALENGLCLIDATHAGTEMPVLKRLFSCLQGVRNGLQCDVNCFVYASQPWRVTV